MKRLLALTVVLLAGCATTRAQSSQPADPVKLRKDLAQSLLHYGEYAAASRPLLELTQLTPEDPEVHAMLGDVYREQGLYAQADGAYRSALTLNPNCARALGGLGVLADLRGDRGDGALEPLRRAAALEPQNPVRHNNLGFALYVRGRYQEAIDAYSEALRLEPTSALARNNLGFAWGRLGELEKARREFERATGPAAAANNVGMLHELAGDHLAACHAYREAISLQGTLKVAFVNAERACNRPPPPPITRSTP